MQKFLQLLFVEPRVAGGDVSARLVAGRNEIQLAVFDSFHSIHLKASFRRVTFIVGGVDSKYPRLDFLQPRRGIVVDVAPSGSLVQRVCAVKCR